MSKTFLVLGVAFGVGVGYWLMFMGGASTVTSMFPPLSAVGGVIPYIKNSFSDFLASIRQNPIPAATMIGSVGSVVGSIAYKIYNGLKQRSQQAVANAQQKEGQAYSAAGQLAEQNTLLQNKLATIPDAQTEVAKATTELSARAEEAELLVNQLTREKDQLQGQVSILTKELENLKLKESYIVK